MLWSQVTSPSSVKSPGHVGGQIARGGGPGMTYRNSPCLGYLKHYGEPGLKAGFWPSVSAVKVVAVSTCHLCR